MRFWADIAARIAEQLAAPCAYSAHQPLAGGDINRATLLTCGDRQFFVKLNTARYAEMFSAEAAGLRALAAATALRVPEPICEGVQEDKAFLVLEYLELGGSGDQYAAGAALAELHRISEPRFGWLRDNTIGTTPQHNDWHTDWSEFWRERRLGFQLDLAEQQGYGRDLRAGRELQARVGELLHGHKPIASLLHGDLWRGNFAFDAQGRPAIFDPAVYFGDREADLAMTELFGGFSAEFYAGYGEHWPPDAGYAVRKTLYNLYHVLNHLHLFGGGYLHQARAMIAQLLAELR